MSTTVVPREKTTALVQALAERLRSIPGLTVLEYEPIGGVPVPSVTIGAIDLDRRGLNERESELGRDDWLYTIAIKAHMSYDHPETDWVPARALIGELASAIDADQGLGGEALEARMTRLTSGYNDEASERRLIVLEADVEAIALMPTP